MADGNEETYYQVMEQGFLTQAQADAAWVEHQDLQDGSGFADFLFQRSLIDEQQVAQLLKESPSDDLDATMIGGDAPADPEAPEDDPVIGQVFDGCKVIQLLGQGGMGSVYTAEAEDGTTVVVKFLAVEQAANPVWRGRFLREARMMQSITHPNVVRIHSVGEGDPPYIVMELVEGEELAEALTARKIFPPLEAARIVRDIAHGLTPAHAQGVIHRDIKPANVLLTHEGQVKVLDFGLAKSVEGEDGLTLPGQVLGTPHYMAPEQWGDHAVDVRCDVFALGATLYHLVCGVVPFAGKTAQAISARARAGEFEPPSQYAPDIPVDLELVLYKMLEVNRDFRYPSAQQCAEDLQRVLDGGEVEVPRLLLQSSEGHGERFPLLPGDYFLFGRDESACTYVIKDRSVSRQHAHIERGPTGYNLVDLGSSGGTYVGGLRAESVVLKNNDRITFGQVPFLFKDGGLAQQRVARTQRLTQERLEVRSVPLPFVSVLAEEGDRRAVVGLLEDLAPDAQSSRVDLACLQVEELLGKETAEQLRPVLAKKLRRLRSRTPHYLFGITHENLGDEVLDWLNWWDAARSDYPPQIAPLRTRPQARLRVVAGEAEARTIPLSNAATLTVGREKKQNITLLSRSVSRLHATLMRFHSRLVLRDEGSRYGTLINGETVKICFLQPGDQIVMGEVELRFEVDSFDPEQTSVEAGLEGMVLDAEAWFALAELGHETTLTGLVTLLDVVEDPTWMHQEAAALFPDQPKKSQGFYEQIKRVYTKRGDQAREQLPKMLDLPPEASVEELRAAFQQLSERDLPTQLLPAGWFPAATQSGHFRI